MGVKEEETGNFDRSPLPRPGTMWSVLDECVIADSWFEARSKLALKLGISDVTTISPKEVKRLNNGQ